MVSTVCRVYVRTSLIRNSSKRSCNTRPGKRETGRNSSTPISRTNDAWLYPFLSMGYPWLHAVPHKGGLTPTTYAHFNVSGAFSMEMAPRASEINVCEHFKQTIIGGHDQLFIRRRLHSFSKSLNTGAARRLALSKL